MGLQRALVCKIKSTGRAPEFFFAPNGGYCQVGTFPKGSYDKNFILYSTVLLTELPRFGHFLKETTLKLLFLEATARLGHFLSEQL
jgi:hypothetical protein